MHRNYFLSTAGSALALVVVLGAGCGRAPPPPTNAPPVVNTTPAPPPPTVNAPPANRPSVPPPPPSTDGRVRGSSTGAFPYAAIDAQNIVVRSIGKRGGVLTTTAGPTRVSLVIPPGRLIDAVEVTLAPYTALPSGPQHIPLATTYGHGVQVVIAGLGAVSLRSEPAYLVFDVTGGRVMDGLRNAKRDPWNRCDPQSAAFYPSICAAERGVPATRVVDPRYAVVTPIHGRPNQPLVFTRSTIPIGVDGLIITEVFNGDAYVPQPLDRALRNDLVRATGTHRGNDLERLELAAHLIAANQLSAVTSPQLLLLAALNSDTPDDAVKSMAVSAAIAAEIERQRAAAPEDSDERSDLDDLAAEFPALVQRIRAQLLEDARGEVGGRYPGDAIVPSGAAVIRLARGRNADALGVRDALAEGLRTQLRKERIGAARWSRFDAFETLLLFRRGTFRAALSDAEVDALVDALGDLARGEAEGTLGDQNASIDDLIRAAELALSDLVDDSGLFDKIWDRIEEMLEKALEDAKTKGEAEAIAGRAFGLELDALGNRALAKAEKLPDEPCSVLMKKNLKNFGINTCE